MFLINWLPRNLRLRRKSQSLSYHIPPSGVLSYAAVGDSGDSRLIENGSTYRKALVVTNWPRPDTIQINKNLFLRQESC